MSTARSSSVSVTAISGFITLVLVSFWVIEPTSATSVAGDTHEQLTRRNPELLDKRNAPLAGIQSFAATRAVVAGMFAGSSFTENGATLNIVLDTANTNVAIVSNGASYTLSLAGDTWSGVDSARVTGNGTATLTVTAAGQAAFTTGIVINDASAAGVSVTFNDSFPNVYINSFNINLTNAAADQITFNGGTNFAGSSALSASTTRNILVNGSTPKTVSTVNGNLTLLANQQASPTSGSFHGIMIIAGTISSSTGAILLQGRGGDSGGSFGIVMGVASQISSTGTGANAATVTLAGTGRSGANVIQSHGIAMFNTNTRVTSVAGAVNLTGIAGSGTVARNIGVYVCDGCRVISTGTGATAAPLTINGTGGTGPNEGDGVIIEGGGAVLSVDGAVNITGDGGAGTGQNVGVAVLFGGKVEGSGSAAVTLTGTGAGSGGATFQNHGVSIIENSGGRPSVVTAKDGPLSITGTPGPAASSFAINIGSNMGEVTATGTGNILMTGDSMNFDPTNAVVDAGTDIVTLQTKTLNTAINLGGADAAGTLGLTDAELDRVQAGTLRVGRNDASASGAISLTSLIDLTAGANTVATLHLITGANVGDGTAGEQVDLKVQNLAIETATGIANPSSNFLDIQVSNLAASKTVGGPSGIGIANSGGLTVATVDGVTGVSSAGSIVLTASSPITVDSPVTDTIGGLVSLTAGAANSTNAADVLTINANVSAPVLVILNGNTLVINAATVSGPASGILAQFGGAATFNNGSVVSTVNGFMQLFASSMTLNGNATHMVTGSGGIQLTTDDITIAVTATISADDAVVNGNNSVDIRNLTPGRPISLGANTAGTLGLTEAELDRIRGERLRFGINNSFSPGTISLNGQVDLSTSSTVGGFTIPTMLLATTADVADGTAGEQVDLKVANLAILAGTGIGSSNDINITTANLAFRNTTSNHVQISNTGALTITGVDFLTSSLGNLAAGGTTTLTAASPLTFATSISSVATFAVTTAEAVPAAINVDNITVNPGVTVQSTAGDLVFFAGDNINVNTTAVVQAPNGSVDFRAGVNDNDNEGVMTLNGLVAANGSTGTVALDVLSTNLAVPGANAVNQGAAGSITGAGLMLLNSPGASGPFALNASATNLVSNIAASANSHINYRNNGALSVAAVNSPTKAIALPGILTNSHNVTLTTITGALSLIQNLNAGTATVTLVTPTGINGGGGSITAGTLNLDESTSSVAHSWSVTPADFTDNGGGAVPYSGVTNFTIQGGTGNETYNVTPSSNTTFNVHGNNPTPPASPGDSLFVDYTGVTSPSLNKTSTPNGFQGAFTFGNRKPVNFTTIETLNCTTPITITCPAGIAKYTESGQRSATINPGVPTATGGCANPSVTGKRSDGKPLSAPYPVGPTIITWTATDGINSISCSQTIMVMVPSGGRRLP